MSFNRTEIEYNSPKLTQNEHEVIERKGVQASFLMPNQSYAEIGTLFLTNKRLVFLTDALEGLSSFESEIHNIRALIYYKRNGQRCIEGLVYLGACRNNECKFVFKYENSDFRSLISILFSMIGQVKGGNHFCATPGMKHSKTSVENKKEAFF